MKFRIYRTHDRRGKEKPTSKARLEGNKWVIDLGSLDDLIALTAEEDEPIIIFQGSPGTMTELEIYSHLREEGW